MNAGFATASTLILVARFEAAPVVRLLETQEITFFAGVPAIINGIRERFGVTIAEGYGLSEASPTVMTSPPGIEPRPGSIGKPIWGVEVKLIDDEWNTIEDAGATVTEEQLVAWARERMAAYEYPRIVEFVDEIPMTAAGKPLKRDLR